jgi:hydrogenase maturation protein HypF
VTVSPAVRHAVRLRITGVVQGVGFRPFVYRLATELGLGGFVGNDPESVFAEVEGPAASLDTFLARLRPEAPPLARLETVEVAGAAVSGRTTFAIVESAPAGALTTAGVSARAVTAVSPDAAVCAACLAEMWDPDNRRHLHPFITCTDCGPRFTITRRVPYDRPATTMDGFSLCATCAVEYADPRDRRYHAQPIACHDCGPTLSLTFNSNFTGADLLVTARDAPVAVAREALRAGAILAVKGIGGYHLVCDATSDAAVGELRRRKGRADKPFAVMTADLGQAATVADLTAEEQRLLGAPSRPIVLARARPGSRLSRLVAPGNPLVGILLPYTPLHHLLFHEMGPGGPLPVLGPLVMTSSNRSGEPIAYRDDGLTDRIGGLVDGILAHDRPIHVPCDDSVVRVATDGRAVLLRRSRGYAPLPLRIPPTTRDVLAVGADTKNAFCVARGRRAWMSQHIGDMANLETLEAFEASVAQFCGLYRVTPEIVAVDAHPGYLSSRWARLHHPEAVVEVQHHHAHVAAVMAEHGLDPARAVIGLAFDGTGYGDDGTIWGGEILEADAFGYRRAGHLAAVALPGGDAAIRHPRRVALAHLHAAGLAWDEDLAPVRDAGARELAVVARQLTTGFGCVATTSMGRLFDAVSSLLDLRHEVSYEAQAAIELEHAAAGHLDDAVALGFDCGSDGVYDAAPVVADLVRARRAGASVGAAAAGFHLAVADLAVHAARASRARTGPATVVLTGGVWQNTLLSTLARARLGDAGFDVRSHRLVPPNDGGLALGQVFVAAHRGRTAAVPRGSTAAVPRGSTVAVPRGSTVAVPRGSTVAVPRRVASAASLEV